MEPTQTCPLINTVRLKPYRQKINKTIMTITDSGHVSMEIMVHLNNQQDHLEAVKEVFYISPDGTRVEVYRSEEGVASFAGCPMSCEPHRVFTYPNLPAKQWRKYQHAYKFVDVIKSRTAKVLLITERAKCKLMENSPDADFQTCFTNGTTMLLNKDKVQITDPNVGSIVVDSISVNNWVGDNIKDMVQYAQQCHLQCLEIEKSVSVLQSRDTSQDFFPITVGTSSTPFQLTTEPSRFTTGLPEAASLNNANDIGHVMDLPQGYTWISTDKDLQQFQTDSFNLSSHAICQPQTVTESKDAYSVDNYHPLLHEGSPGLNLHSQSEKVVQFKDLRLNSLSTDSGINHPSAVTTPKKMNGLLTNSCINHQLTMATPQTVEHTFNSVRNEFHQEMYKNQDSLTSFPYMMEQFSSFHICNHAMEDQGSVTEHGQMLPCSLHTLDNLLGVPNISEGNYRENRKEDVNVPPICQSSVMDNIQSVCADFSTPKKLLNSERNFHCYSVDSKKEHHRRKERNSLCVEALVSADEMKNVRRNLFSESMLAEPLASPVPVSSPHTIGQDLLACRPTPCLELSDCSDSEESDAHNIPLCGAQIQNLSGTQAKPNVRIGQELFHSPQKSLQQCHCPTERNNIHLQNNLVSSTHSLKLQDSKIPPPASNFQSSPVKKAPVRKIASISNLQISSVTTNTENCDIHASPVLELYKKSPDNFVHQQEYSSGDKKSLNLNSDESMNESQNCSHSSKGLQNDLVKEALNQSKSDSGFQSQQKPVIPKTPQKEFVMPSSNRVGHDMSLPLHVRNSLDVSTSSYYSDSSSPSSGCDPIRQVFVPYTGWASFYATGAVWILYNDGTQLGVKSSEAAMTYIDQDGIQTRYGNTDVVPEIIKLKLEKLPTVLDLLMKSPVTKGS